MADSEGLKGTVRLSDHHLRLYQFTPSKLLCKKRKLTIAKMLFLRYNVKQSRTHGMNREKSLFRRLNMACFQTVR